MNAATAAVEKTIEKTIIYRTMCDDEDVGKGVPIFCDTCDEYYNPSIQNDRNQHKHKDKKTWNIPVTVKLVRGDSWTGHLHCYQRMGELKLQIIEKLQRNPELIPEDLANLLKGQAFQGKRWHPKPDPDDPDSANSWTGDLHPYFLRLICTGKELKKPNRQLRFDGVKYGSTIYLVFRRLTPVKPPKLVLSTSGASSAYGPSTNDISSSNSGSSSNTSSSSTSNITASTSGSSTSRAGVGTNTYGSNLSYATIAGGRTTIRAIPTAVTTTTTTTPNDGATGPTGPTETNSRSNISVSIIDNDQQS